MFEAVQEYAAFISGLISTGTIVYVWLTSRSRGNEEHLEKTDKKLIDHENRLVKLESEFVHLPTKEGQHRLELAMSELIGDMKQMTEAVTGTKHTVARMEQAMLERGKHG